jgi:drug/metabolite transporter superfamily protein YnfA
MDGMGGGYAISFACLIIGITAFIVIFMYRGRARAVDRMLSGENVLAHWKYAEHEWEEYTEKAYQAETSGKWGLYIFVMVIAAVVCFFFWIFVEDSGTIMLGVMGGLALILAATILITTNYDRWQNRRYHGEVIISRDGVYVNRLLHLWRGWGTTLDRTEYNRQDRMLEFTYSAPSRTGRNYATARVPVPIGLENKAEELLKLFTSDSV